MAFTEAEKRQWHARRRAGRTGGWHDEADARPECGHCGNPFVEGVVTPEFALCDVCNGD